MTSDLETDVTVTSRAGFKALELWAKKVDRFLETRAPEDLKALFARNGIQPQAINSIEFIGFRGKEFPLIQDRLHELCSIALVIGCPTIVVVPSPAPDRNLSWGETQAEYVRVLRDLGDTARPYGVRLGFEFLGFGWCSVRTPRAAFEIIKEVDRDNVGLVLDAAHFYAGGGLMSEIEQLDAGRLFSFHLDDLEDAPKEAASDATRLLPGKGVIPLNDICERLHRIGYNGPCSIELFRPEYWEWDPGILALEAHKAACEVLAPYFELE